MENIAPIAVSMVATPIGILVTIWVAHIATRNYFYMALLGKLDGEPLDRSMRLQIVYGQYAPLLLGADILATVLALAHLELASYALSPSAESLLRLVGGFWFLIAFAILVLGITGVFVLRASVLRDTSRKGNEPT